MMQPFSPMGASAVAAATASSVSASITMPDKANCLHIANCSATLHVSVAVGRSAPTATLGGSLTLPPMGHIVIAADSLITHVAAIGSAAGPTNVVFTPGRTG